jgi:tetratricopeptide (TPR) repeat protein
MINRKLNMQPHPAKPIQLELDLLGKEGCRKKHLWSFAQSQLFSCEKNPSKVRKMRIKISNALRLSSSYKRGEALSLAQSAICDARSLGDEYLGFTMMRLSRVAADCLNSKLRYYWLATAYRLLRKNAAFDAWSANCAYQIAEGKFRSLKDSSDSLIWLKRAHQIAQDDFTNFNWLADVSGMLGDYYREQSQYEKADGAYLKAIELIKINRPNSYFFLCSLHIKRANCSRVTGRPDEEASSFENARVYFDQIKDSVAKKFLAQQIEVTLRKSLHLIKHN